MTRTTHKRKRLTGDLPTVSEGGSVLIQTLILLWGCSHSNPHSDSLQRRISSKLLALSTQFGNPLRMLFTPCIQKSPSLIVTYCRMTFRPRTDLLYDDSTSLNSSLSLCSYSLCCVRRRNLTMSSAECDPIVYQCKTVPVETR